MTGNRWKMTGNPTLQTREILRLPNSEDKPLRVSAPVRRLCASGSGFGSLVIVQSNQFLHNAEFMQNMQWYASTR